MKLKGIALAESAVFATVWGHVGERELAWRRSSVPFCRDKMAHLSLKNGDEFVGAHVTFVLRPLRCRETAFSCFFRKFITPCHQPRIRAKTNDFSRFLPWNDSQDALNAPVESHCFGSRNHISTLAQGALLAQKKTPT